MAAIIRYTRPDNKPIIFNVAPSGAEDFLHVCDNEAHLKQMLGTLGIPEREVRYLRPYAGFQLAHANEYPVSSNLTIRVVPCFDWADELRDDQGRLFLRVTDFYEAESYQAAERMHEEAMSND